MNRTLRIENRAGITERAFVHRSAELPELTTMARALAWFASQSPPVAPDGMVTQDEFSFDILVPIKGGERYLSFASD